MTRPRLSIDARLTLAQVAIDNALANPDITAHLEEYGYTSAQLAQGKALYERTVALVQRQKDEYGDQTSATATLEAAWEKADMTYMRHLKVARIAFKDAPGTWQKLGMSGERKQTISGWLGQARQFYINALANPAIQARLAEFGISTAKLQAGQVEVQAVEAANAAQESERGEAQNATKARDAALDELQAWTSDFFGIARVALEDEPQLLEKIGVLAPS